MMNIHPRPPFDHAIGDRFFRPHSTTLNTRLPNWTPIHVAVARLPPCKSSLSETFRVFGTHRFFRNSSLAVFCWCKLHFSCLILVRSINFVKKQERINFWMSFDMTEMDNFCPGNNWKSGEGEEECLTEFLLLPLLLLFLFDEYSVICLECLWNGWWWRGEHLWGLGCKKIIFSVIGIRTHEEGF